MAVPEFITSIVEPWSSLYESSKALISLVRFMHIGGLLLGGGAAVTFDRASIRARRGGPEYRAQHLAQLRPVHRVVILGLGLIAASGLMMASADLESFLASWTFWVKMALVLALAANGYVMVRIEGRLRPDEPAGWTALCVTARISLILWFAIVLAGSVLVIVA